MDAGDSLVPIIQPKTFSVCPHGHVSEAPAHPCVQFREPDGTVTQAIVCGRCQFEFFASTFPAVILPKEKTRQEAEDIARGMEEAWQSGIPEQVVTKMTEPS